VVNKRGQLIADEQDVTVDSFISVSSGPSSCRVNIEQSYAGRREGGVAVTSIRPVFQRNLTTTSVSGN
jgi:hypothetical protein